MADAVQARTAGRIAFTYPAFRRYQMARFCTVTGSEMQSVAVGWQVYEITHRPLDLGLVGLAQFLPAFLLFLVAGHTADRFNRRTIVSTCFGGYALCSALLLAIALRGTHSVHPIYVVLVILGVARSFSGPAAQALVPQLVAEEHFPNAVAWNSTIFQAAVILGPALGGLIYAWFHGAAVVYACSMTVSLAAMSIVATIQLRSARRVREPVSLAAVLGGFHYVWRQKVILGSISLDLFAVLLGGAVALLPVYAKEILHTGPSGLGILRSAPAVGAAVMAIALAHRPLQSRAGATMLWCVAGFGVFTIVFGLSRNLILSLLALVLVGATDMVSVIIRSTLVQLQTPDAMRGRVSAVNALFIGASNELGQFESGLTAHWFGTVPAVVLGGVGTLLVIVLWSWLFPDLRRANRLTAELEPVEHETP